jgi:hypothetical protein
MNKSDFNYFNIIRDKNYPLAFRIGMIGAGLLLVAFIVGKIFNIK